MQPVGAWNFHETGHRKGVLDGVEVPSCEMRLADGAGCPKRMRYH